MKFFKTIIYPVLILASLVAVWFFVKKENTHMLDARIVLNQGEDFLQWASRNEAAFNSSDFGRLQAAYSELYVAMHFPARDVVATEAFMRRFVTGQTPRRIIIEGYLLMGVRNRIESEQKKTKPDKDIDSINGCLTTLDNYLPNGPK